MGKALWITVVTLATARLTRFITTDYLGHWWIVRPARRWAIETSRQHLGHVLKNWQTVDGSPSSEAEPDVVWRLMEEFDPSDAPPRIKLVKGLDCPFCVGFWIGGAVLLTGIICTALGPIPRGIWRFVVGTFALNYVVAHLSSRIDG